MVSEIPVMISEFLNPHYGIIVRGPEVMAVDQQDNPNLDLDQVMLREQPILRSIDPVNGRRRYQGDVKVDNRPVQIIFTPYADCGSDETRFRVAFPK